MALLGAILLAIFVLDDAWRLPVIAAGGAVEVAESAFWIWLSKRRRPQVGLETVVGAAAIAASSCRPDGQVRVGGELWRARCEAGVDAGEPVRVVAVEGLTLLVEPVASAG